MSNSRLLMFLLTLTWADVSQCPEALVVLLQQLEEEPLQKKVPPKFQWKSPSNSHLWGRCGRGCKVVITFTFQQNKNLISSHHLLHFSLSIFGIPLTIITMNNSDNAVVRDKLHQHTKSRPKKLSNTSIKMDLEVWILRSFRESWN